ncbi:MAG: ParB/RepB/Spo0J family partition protein [bacterium]|nr:ParB N-terminal domain-containing protein [Myxococcales bacterium]MCB9550920.1 ParB N-terminal domain-containing protein [Myxococcales bacterium]
MASIDFREAVAARSRRIAAEARARARVGAGPGARGQAPGWLVQALGYLPDGIRQTLRDALGPDEAAEMGQALLAAARREKEDLRHREAALDAAREDLDRARGALAAARAEVHAREKAAERALAQAQRAAKEAAVERRVPLAEIRWDAKQAPRRIRGVARLAANIKRFGQLTPVVVRPVEGGLALVTGYRRMAALGAAGVTHARVRVVEGLDDATAAALYIAENALVDGVPSNAVAQLARAVGDRPGFADVLPLIEADDEAAVEEMFLDDMAGEARHHLAEGAAWVASLRPHWAELDGADQKAVAELVRYFAKVAPRLASP